MKPAFIVLLFFITIPLFASAQCIVLTHYLIRGLTDATGGDGQVVTLQKLLVPDYLTINDPGAYGYFGPLTQGAVRNFQTVNDIDPVGSVGPITRGRIKTLTCAMPDGTTGTASSTLGTNSASGTASASLYPNGGDSRPAGQGAGKGGVAFYYGALTPATLMSVFSDKTHGFAGVFGIPLPLVGTLGVEDRVNGPTDLVLTFATPIGKGPNFSVSLSSGSVASTVVSGNTLTINMSGATNDQILNVNVNDVVNISTQTGSNYSFSAGVDTADMNGDGVVNFTDFQLLASQFNAVANHNNFKYDLNADGTVDFGDYQILVAHYQGTFTPSLTGVNGQ